MNGDEKFMVGLGILGLIWWASRGKKDEILEYGPPNVGSGEGTSLVAGGAVTDLRRSDEPAGSGVSSSSDCLCPAGDNMPGVQVACDCSEPGAMVNGISDLSAEEPLGALGARWAAGSDDGVI